MSVKVIVLCAGKGTRMKSEKAKVMHKIMGRPMSEYIYNLAKSISDKKPVFVVGHNKEEVIDYYKEKVEYVNQDIQLGTGHAIKLCKDVINEDEDVLILYGDTPLITQESIKKVVENKENSDAIIVTSIVENPFNYGRIIKDQSGNFVKIVEEKDATDDQRKIKEINSGIYFIKGSLIKKHIDELKDNNVQKEFYLTDIFEILKDNGKKISTLSIPHEEILGVNSRVQMEDARYILQRRINTKLMESGVTLINPDTIYIEDTVEIEKDTVIYPNNIITGNTKIGSDCILYAENEIHDSIIKDNVEIKRSYIEESMVDQYTTIGPYAHLRPKSNIKRKVKIGNFVEIKNSTIDDGSKASHLAYVGDAEVGKDVNIGCGVIFVNYDGKHKQKSIIKDKAFIGSNANVVAPVTVEEKGYVATGSTVTQDVPKESLCIARSRQVIKEDWTKKSKLLD